MEGRWRKGGSCLCWCCRGLVLQKHDEAGYLKLLQETKNERLMQLVQQTERYMQQIGSLVVEQREREGIIVPSVRRCRMRASVMHACI